MDDYLSKPLNSAALAEKLEIVALKLSVIAAC